jgi:hypothetical protein
LGLLLWEVDEETLGRLDIIGCDVNLLIVRRYLHYVVSLAQLVTLLVQDYAILIQDFRLPQDTSLCCITQVPVRVFKIGTEIPCRIQAVGVLGGTSSGQKLELP